MTEEETRALIEARNQKALDQGGCLNCGKPHEVCGKPKYINGLCTECAMDFIEKHQRG